ncbi:MAG: extracellular solute-binding protein [Actinomadura sp.]
MTDQLQALKSSFEKKYPKIKLTYVRGGGDEGLPKVEAEARTGRGIADVAVSASLSWMETHTRLFEAPRGPAFGAPGYDRAENLATGTYYVISGAVLTYGWNTDLFPQGIRAWRDLFSPELAGGKIGVISPDTPARVDFYNYLTETQGADFLDRLAAQKPRIYPSALPVAAALTSGEIAAGVFVEPLTDEKSSGAPVDWGLARPAWGNRFYSVNLKSAPHPNAAQVLADFMVTAQGQQAVARNAASVLDDVPGAVSTTANLRKQDLSRLSPQKVREFRAGFERMFGG